MSFRARDRNLHPEPQTTLPICLRSPLPEGCIVGAPQAVVLQGTFGFLALRYRGHTI